MTPKNAPAEVELAVRTTDIEVGDYLYVGHGWWGQVKRNDVMEPTEVHLVLVGGLEWSLAMMPDHVARIRRMVSVEPEPQVCIDSGEQRVVDLLAALETSVNDAREARKRHGR